MYQKLIKIRPASQASEESIQEARSFAYKNLLDYLGKDKNSLRAQDLEKYFVLVDVRVNTESKNPDNQKTIFALKAEYVDALPDSQVFRFSQWAFLRGSPRSCMFGFTFDL